MARQTSITLKQLPIRRTAKHFDEKTRRHTIVFYRVEGLKNRTAPRIGEEITETDVEQLIIPGTTITIK